MINNTKDTVYIPPYDSSTFKLYSRSYFIGEIGNKEICFEKINRRSKIPPNDSARILLFYDQYKPKSIDSIFIDQIKNIKIKYDYKDETATPLNYIRDVKIYRTSSTKFIRLDDYTGIEGAFSFGNEEFK